MPLHAFAAMVGRSSVKVLPTKADVALAKRRSKARGVTLVILAFIFIAVLWAIGAFLFSHSVASHPNEEKAQQALPRNAFKSWPNKNDYPNFSVTLKECLPASNPKCLQYVPEVAKGQRIAVLRPPGAFGDIFTRFVKNVVEYHSFANSTNLELIPTSHVPPYGYGKTHGYTKIIRLSVSPLMTHAADLLRGSENAGIQDLKEVVRQLVRWHCRLSHVAAHTSLLTVAFDSIISSAHFVDEQISSFLNLPHKSTIQNLLDDASFLETDELLAMLKFAMKSIYPILTTANSQVSQPIEDVIHDVIQDELDKTNNLQQWPCLSFWSVGDEPNPHVLTPVAKKAAAAFSPNCTAEYAHCGVPRDRCEERGDVICKN